MSKAYQSMGEKICRGGNRIHFTWGFAPDPFLNSLFGYNQALLSMRFFSLYDGAVEIASFQRGS